MGVSLEIPDTDSSQRAAFGPIVGRPASVLDDGLNHGFSTSIHGLWLDR